MMYPDETMRWPLYEIKEEARYYRRVARECEDQAITSMWPWTRKHLLRERDRANDKAAQLERWQRSLTPEVPNVPREMCTEARTVPREMCTEARTDMAQKRSEEA